MHIREYKDTDKQACIALFDSNVPHFFSEDEKQGFIDWLDLPDRDAYYVVELEERIVACGGIFHETDKKIAGLAWGMVDRSLHKQGIGGRFTRFRLDLLTEKFPDHIHSIETSQHTEAFYKKLGFVTTHITPDGFAPGIDKYEMERSLLQDLS